MFDPTSPATYQADAVAPETAAVNADIAARQALLPDTWAFPPALIREARRQGRGIFPLPPHSPRAEVVEIPGKRGAIPLRVVRPAGGGAKGIYLHLHFGGWTLGSTDMHDDWLCELADGTGLVVVSVEYKLAPEWPYPAGPDDCESAALWLNLFGRQRFGASLAAIGGESAGAHLSVVTLARLRDRHGLTPFLAANLNAGCYDLALTPSARAAAGKPKLILEARDIREFVRCFAPAGVPLDDPDLSPLHQRLEGMPPTLFTVGTADPLLDDSLFMAARWRAAGVAAELAVWPGGAHVFQMFPLPMSEACKARQIGFVNKALG